MPGTILTDTRVSALKSRKTVREVRDGRLRGFGVRVFVLGPQAVLRPLPASRRAHLEDRRRRREHERCRGAFRCERNAGRHPARRGCTCRAGEMLFEAVAETTFRRYERVWKPRTLVVNRNYLRNQLLPHFAGREIAGIDRQEVRNWFARLRATPVAADRSMPVLSVIMREAERMGLRPEGSNPCRGIRRYRRKGRERFLTDDELRRLSARLAAHEARRPQQVRSSACCCSPAAARAKSSPCNGPTTATAICISATARWDPEPSGSRSRPGAFSTALSGPTAGCSPACAATGPAAGTGWTISGPLSAPRRS